MSRNPNFGTDKLPDAPIISEEVEPTEEELAEMYPEWSGALRTNVKGNEWDVFETSPGNYIDHYGSLEK